MLESLLVGIAGSLSAEWLSNSGSWILSRSPVEKAVDDTCQYYDRVRGKDVKEALENWIEGGAFVTLLQNLERGELEEIEERFVESFRREGGLYLSDPTRSKTKRVLNRFTGHLKNRLLKAGELGLLYDRVETAEQRTREGQDDLLRGQGEMGDLLLQNLDKTSAVHRIVEELQEGRTTAAPPSVNLEEIEERFEQASRALLSWPRTLQGSWITRNELDILVDRIASEASSVTLVEGEPGTGKSALLSKLSHQLFESESAAVAALKTDALPKSLDSADRVIPGIPSGMVAGIKALADCRPVVIVLDQLDALSSVSDTESSRLNAILDLVARLRGVTGVHVVASIRPFEREVDARLQWPSREVMTLQKLSWGDTAEMLDGAGHKPDRIGDELRKILSVPAYLKIFLDVAEPDSVYES